GTDVVHGSRNFVASEKNKGHVPLARNVPDVTRPAPKAPNAIVGLAGDYDQSDRSFDIGVQVHSHVVFAGLTDGAVRQADISLGHFNAGGGQGVSDVGGADGAEQFAFIARSCGDGDFQFVQLGSASFGRSLLLGSQFFQLGATGFERGNVLGSSRGSFALRQQVVTAVTGTYIHLVAQVAQVGDFFQQDDFHLSLTS